MKQIFTSKIHVDAFNMNKKIFLLHQIASGIYKEFVILKLNKALHPELLKYKQKSSKKVKISICEKKITYYSIVSSSERISCLYNKIFISWSLYIYSP